MKYFLLLILTMVSVSGITLSVVRADEDPCETNNSPRQEKPNINDNNDEGDSDTEVEDR